MTKVEVCVTKWSKNLSENLLPPRRFCEMLQKLPIAGKITLSGAFSCQGDQKSNMKANKLLQSVRTAGNLALVLALASSALTARANVFASNIKLNGNLRSISSGQGSIVNISYILNEPATAGVTINILSGTNVVDTIQIASPNVGTVRGANSVPWGGTNSSGEAVGLGVYSVSIIASAVGNPIWTQTSLDSTNNVAVDAQGIAVDNNSNSPYYGRVMLGCASAGGSAHGVTQNCGIYKMNADGSPADEGSFGFGVYASYDAGSATGAMSSDSGLIPYRLRIGEDDRLYMLDYTSLGAVIAFDMQVTTNQIVIDEGSGGTLGGPNNYSGNPDYGDLVYGINNFDVTSTTTANAAIWLCDIDSPNNWGVWVYHLKNGASDPADTKGTQAVSANDSSDLSQNSGGGCMVDTNLDIFISQNVYYNSAFFRTMEYTNWELGVLPPEGGGSKYAYGTATNQVLWGVGTSDATFEGVQDTVLNNRQHPTLVALPTVGGGDVYPGIRVLNAGDGSVVTVMNGGTNQTLTNLDYPNQYTCAAWDNVGNLYGASSSLNLWRVWSPPGSNQAATLAVATIQVLPPAPAITSIVLNGTNVTINFTGGASEAASAFTLISSSTVNPPGSYVPVTTATITQLSAGIFQASTAVNGSTRFYRLER